MEANSSPQALNSLRSDLTAHYQQLCHALDTQPGHPTSPSHRLLALGPAHPPLLPSSPITLTAATLGIVTPQAAPSLAAAELQGLGDMISSAVSSRGTAGQGLMLGELAGLTPPQGGRRGGGGALLSPSSWQGYLEPHSAQQSLRPPLLLGPPSLNSLLPVYGAAQMGVRVSQVVAVRQPAPDQGSQLLQEESILLYPPPGKTFEGWSSSSTLGRHGRGARGGQEQGLGRLALGAIDGLDDLRFRPPRTQQLDGGLDLLPPRPGRSTSRAVLDQLDAFLSDFASQQTSAKPALLPARTG